MLKLSFKQTRAEFMVRVASSLIFNKLIEANFPVTTIHEVIENVQYGYTEKAAKEEIGPKYVRITDLQDGQINWDTVPYCKCEQPEQYLLSENDLLFARTGATTGKTHLVRDIPPTSVFASYLIRVRPQKDINPDYLYSFFQSDLYWSQISNQKEGSAQPNVNGQKLGNLTLPLVDNQIQSAISTFLSIVRLRQDGRTQELPELPPPLTEQHRIVEHIEALAERVNEARNLNFESSKISGSLMSSTKSKVFTELAEHYEQKRLGDVYEIVGGGTPSTSNPDYWSGDIPWITSANIHGLRDIRPQKHITETAISDSATTLVPSNTIIVVTRVSLGKVAITLFPLCFSQDSQALLPKDNSIYPDFALHFLSHAAQEFKEQSRGTTISGITKQQLKNVSIPIPSLEEQRRLVAYLDGLQAQVAQARSLQEESAKELSTLMPSILDKAFKGEL